MAKSPVSVNESRFRRGALVLFLISALSAGSTAALYHGVNLKIFYSTSLAFPVVTEIAIRAFLAGILMEKVRYYWYLGSLGLAAVLGGIALLATGISLSGNIFSASFSNKRVSKAFSALGIAQLMSARALSAFGLLFYLLDGVISALLVMLSPQTFTPYYFFLMGNLLLHLVVLTFLGFSFSARVGGGKSASSARASGHGDGKR